MPAACFRVSSTGRSDGRDVQTVVVLEAMMAPLRSAPLRRGGLRNEVMFLHQRNEQSVNRTSYQTRAQ